MSLSFNLRLGITSLFLGQLALNFCSASYNLELTQGSFYRSWMIPGTETSIRIGGEIKANFIFDTDGKVAGNGVRVEIPDYRHLPLGNASDFTNKNLHTRFHAKDSKFFIKSVTPSCYGDIKTYLELDFFTDANIYNSNYQDSNQNEELTTNAVSPRLNHAYGRFYKLLAGKTWTNFQDPESMPEILTEAGLAGRTWIRQTQLRWEDDFGCVAYGIAIENPETDFTIVSGVGGTGGINDANGNVTGLNKHDKYPDVTAYAKYPIYCGYIRVNGLLRGLQVKGNTLTTADFDDFKLGWGLGFNMKFMQLKVGALFGHGIGRYIDVLQTQALTCDSNSIYKLRGHGAYAAYQHNFPYYIRANVGFGYARVINDNNLLPTLPASTTNKLFTTFFVNAIWSPVSMVDMGLEFIYPRRKVENDIKGNLKRIMFSTKFKF